MPSKLTAIGALIALISFTTYILEKIYDTFSEPAVNNSGNSVAYQHPTQALHSQVDIPDREEREKETGFSEIFRTGNPYPIGGDQIHVGMNLSVLKTTYPDHLYRPDLRSSYIVVRDVGPFFSIQYGFLSDELDPVIQSITYHFEDSKSDGLEERIKQAAVSAFGEQGMQSQRLGATLKWDNVDGLEVEVDETTYSISKPHLEWVENDTIRNSTDDSD